MRAPMDTTVNRSSTLSGLHVVGHPPARIHAAVFVHGSALFVQGGTATTNPGVVPTDTSQRQKISHVQDWGGSSLLPIDLEDQSRIEDDFVLFASHVDHQCVLILF